MPGLFELVSSKTDGAIVRSLDDNSTKFASTRQHQFSHLESIEVYTVRDNVNLADIFKAMEADGGKLPDEKAEGASDGTGTGAELRSPPLTLASALSNAQASRRARPPKHLAAIQRYLLHLLFQWSTARGERGEREGGGGKGGGVV